MIRKLNAPKGLGDAIYLRALALHCLNAGERVEVCTRWPEVFAGLPVKIRSADRFDDYDALSHMVACLHCQVPHIRKIDKFRLACLQAGIAEPVELKLNWAVRNRPLVETITEKAAGKPILLFQPLKLAHNEEQKLMQPNAAAYSGFINSKAEFFRVKVGDAACVEKSQLDCDLDLIGKASISDVFDIATATDVIFGEMSYLPILAQAMDRKFTAMFSRRGIDSKNKRASGVTPERLIQKPHLATVLFDE